MERLPQHTLQFMTSIGKTVMLGFATSVIILMVALAVPRGRFIARQLIIPATFSATYFFFYVAQYVGNTADTMAVDQLCAAPAATALLLFLETRENAVIENTSWLRRVRDRMRLILLSPELPFVGGRRRVRGVERRELDGEAYLLKLRLISQVHYELPGRAV